MPAPRVDGQEPGDPRRLLEGCGRGEEGRLAPRRSDSLASMRSIGKALNLAAMCYVMLNMRRRRVGIRELRQNLSVYLRRVEEGETLEVTERGRAVAVLGPLPRRRVLDELAADGQAVLASRDPRTLVLPERVPLRMSATEALEQLRADER